MIDQLTTLLTTLAAVLICYRAVRLDRILPWFVARKPKPAAASKPGRVNPDDGVYRPDEANRKHLRPAR